MSTIDLTAFTKDQLLILRHDLDRQIALLDIKAREDALEKARAAAREAGYSLEDLINAPAAATGARRGPKPGKTGAVVAPKYANPANPSETWTGRGRPPAWFNDVLATGAGRDSMLIDKA